MPQDSRSRAGITTFLNCQKSNATRFFEYTLEDHPIEYADFEGVIPDGEYGAGTVMVWDTGTWEPEVPDVEEALKKGDLKFTLHEKKTERILGARPHSGLRLEPQQDFLAVDQAPGQVCVEQRHHGE